MQPSVIIYLRSKSGIDIEYALKLLESVTLPFRLFIETTAELHGSLSPSIESFGHGIGILPNSDAPVFSFLDLEKKLPDAVSENSAILRIDLGDGQLDKLQHRLLKGFIKAVLNDNTLEPVAQVFEKHPRLGLLLPIELPRSELSGGQDAGLPEKLAQTLGVSRKALDETYYFPYPLYFLRGGFLKKISDRYPPSARGKTKDDKLAIAIDLGLQGLCKSFGYETGEVRPLGTQLDLQQIAPSYVRKMLDLPTAESRDIEHRVMPRPSPPQDGNLPKVIAYYLPQFHPIPENDEWWGRGFTEWTNVGKAVPRFLGHYQPHLPGELGYYDLRLKETQKRQIELARLHGIHGFCFYYYWFNGKRLLETPLQNFLEDPELDFPFCLCWANENWTRTWDGQERQVLMEQSHAPRDDIQFIKAIRGYLVDPRYIRIDGKPLLLVYRASLLDNPKTTVRRWRDYCRETGIGEIYLAAVLSFDIADPRPFGFDIAVEFPPHRLRLPPMINNSLELVDEKFEGSVYDYRETVLLDALAEAGDEQPGDFPMMHGVMTAWDNDARRPGKGRTFHNATPGAYANWLRLAALTTRRRNKAAHQFVFVNAWNEWAEGAHLEPDRRFGYGYLNATADTLRLFDEEAVSNSVPQELGFSTPASRLAPPHLLPRRSKADLQLYRMRLDALPQRPRLRIVLAFGELDLAVMDTIYTLAEQCYREFDLTVVTCDEFSPDWSQPRPAQVIRRDDLFSGINEAIDGCDEDWVILLAPGDQLFPHSLLAVAEFVAARPDVQLTYSDELVYQNDRKDSVPVFKPDFNLALMHSSPYIGGLLATRRSLFVQLGGFSAGKNGCEELDISLRTFERHGAKAIGHIPEILVWRRLGGRIGAQRPLPVLQELKRRSLSEHAERLGLSAEVTEGLLGGTYRFRCNHPHQPKVSIVISTRDQAAALQRCIESLFANTTYPDYELLIVDNGSSSPESIAFLHGLSGVDSEKIRILSYPEPFNFSAINNIAAREARGEYLLLLNDDTAALHEDWLDAMMEHAQQPDIGIVGCRLVFPSGNLQHAGVVLGLNGVADFPWTGAPMDTPSPLDILQVDRDVSAVTGACLLIRRSVFDEVGGMDEEHLRVAYGDFDLCLKVRERGYRIIWTPHATLMHDAGTTLKEALKDSQAANREQARFKTEQETFYLRWRKALAHDPAYNPNLSLSSRKFDQEANPELARDPIDWHPLPNIAALPGDLHGSGHYRVIQPAQGADETGLTRSRILHGYPHPVVFERLGTDILFTQRQVDDEQIAAVERMKRLTSCRIVMDFDDLLTHIPEHSHHKKTVWKDMPQRLERLCRSVDRMTVSTEPLAEHMRKYHGDIHVVQNALDPVLWSSLASARRRSGKPRIGWVGGISHAGDLAVIREVVRELADEVEWVFMGMCPEDMRPHLTEFHAGVPFAQYPAKMAALGLDLTLAPLEVNPFNECKSNLRILEYGILGIPVIATDIAPYRGDFPITRLANRPKDWIKAIREHVADPDEMERRGQALRQKILDEWMINRHLDAWIKAWTL